MQDGIVTARRSRGRSGGRPRVLTLEQILDGAIELGLSGLSLPVLAAKLQTSTGTLYNYVANRDDLLRKAAVRAAGRPRLDDLGQGWRDLVWTHARALRRFWSCEPQLFAQYLAGLAEPDLMMDYMDALLAALARRGFAVDIGYRMVTAVNTFVLGSVARDLYLRALQDKGTSHSDQVKQAMAGRPDEALPYLRGCALSEKDESAFDFEDGLGRLVASFAQELSAVQCNPPGAGETDAPQT